MKKTFTPGQRVRYTGKSETSDLVGREGEVILHAPGMVRLLPGTVAVKFDGLTDNYIVLSAMLEVVS